MTEQSINTKLINLINELKVPKTEFNKFGNFYYRKTENIFEEIKPLLKKYGLCHGIIYEVVNIGNRYYMKCIFTIFDGEGRESISSIAFAREDESLPKMSASQVSGTAQSYACKYACNNLFLLDDCQEVDGMNNDSNNSKVEKTYPKKLEQKKDDSKNLRDELKNLAKDVFKTAKEYADWRSENELPPSLTSEEDCKTTLDALNIYLETCGIEFK